MDKATIKMPEALESERAVLGSILIDGKEAMKKVGHILTEKDFYGDRHRWIYLAMSDMYKNQQDIDVVTVYEFLKERMLVDESGGAAYLATLTNDVHATSHIVTHAKTVARRSVLRNIILASKDIMRMTQGEQNADLDNLLEKAEERLRGVTRGAAKLEDKLGTVDLEEWRQIARDTEDRSGKVRGISTGFKGIDEMLEGFEPGEMMILTGHTKHGKSRLAANVAKNVAGQGKKVLYINTEMTKLQMGRRFNAMLGEEKLKGQILLNDKAGLTYNNVLQIMERAKEKGVDLVIVDHLHFFSRSVDNQTSEISKIAKDFKDAAVEFELPLIMLCHLQQADTRKMPTLQMIKNSSSIAQDADIVIAVWMDDRPDSPGDETQVLRLAHRSAGGTKKRHYLYNDGMKLSETALVKDMGYDPNRIIEGGSDGPDIDLEGF